MESTHSHIYFTSLFFHFYSYMLFAGRKGHAAVMDCQRMTVGTEMQLKETVYDVQYLHNETMFAGG